MKNTVDIIIHINEDLNNKERRKLSGEVSQIDGIISAGFEEKLSHLMVVAYDNLKTRHIEIIDGVRNRGLNAQLVGWL